MNPCQSCLVHGDTLLLCLHAFCASSISGLSCAFLQANCLDETGDDLRELAICRGESVNGNREFSRFRWTSPSSGERRCVYAGIGTGEGDSHDLDEERNSDAPVSSGRCHGAFQCQIGIGCRITVSVQPPAEGNRPTFTGMLHHLAFCEGTRTLVDKDGWMVVGTGHGNGERIVSDDGFCLAGRRDGGRGVRKAQDNDASLEV